MRVDLFDFDLPEERIALRPANPRDAAKLLVVRPQGMFEDRVVRDLPSQLDPGDLLVFNDTKVIPAQLAGIRRRGDASAEVDATLHMRVSPDRCLAFVRPGKRVAAGDQERHHGGSADARDQYGGDGDVGAAQHAAGNEEPGRRRLPVERDALDARHQQRGYPEHDRPRQEGEGGGRDGKPEAARKL